VLLTPWLLPEERLTAIRLAGVVVGFLGIVFIYSSDVALSAPSSKLGAAVMLLSPLSAAIANMTMKRRSHGMNPLAFLLFPMAYGSFCLFAVGLPLEARRLAFPGPVGIAALLYLAIMGSIVAFSCYVWLLSRVELSKLSLLPYATPITALLLGKLILDEKLGSRVLGGSALVLLGIFLATRPAPPRIPPAQDVQNSATMS
jgi:drug/metabolite transporter (DMT)-like permease